MGTIFVIISILKLIDIKGFIRIFKEYDLVAKKFDIYAKVYPFIELFLGIAFLGEIFIKFAAVVTIIIMSLGTVGIIQKLRLKDQKACACLGSKVHLPLTRFTLVEDIIMGLMALMLLVY
tara:strand:- start:326 stop:685 length:360 start_codon:yes stop_codon:yes gene_type:complete